MKRTAEFTAILGKPGTGKTTMLVKVSKSISLREPVVVVDPDGQEQAWYPFDLIRPNPESVKDHRGIGVMEIKKDETFPLLREHFRNGHMILDDANVYARRESMIEESLTTILQRKRQYGIDIWTTAHGVTQIPAIFFTYITQYIIFPTNDNIRRKRDYIQNFSQFENVINHVNSKAESNPHYCVRVNAQGELK